MPGSGRSRSGFLFAVLLLSPLPEAGATPVTDRSQATRPARTELAAVDDEYHRKLAEYLAARRKYEGEAALYWNSIADKRRMRAAKRRNNQEILIDDYVLTQPPVYSGPRKPVDPTEPAEEPSPRYVPIVSDFLESAAREFYFVPEQPRSESQYKRAYAMTAAAAGLTREQAVRIYAFESGGDGKYDVQAGLEQPTPGARAVSTALGYNQLLTTNSVELMAEKGHRFLEILRGKAARLTGGAGESLKKKIAVLKRMVDFSRSVPDDWSAHERLAGTAKGLAMHALNLDLDVGPLLQTQKLLDSVEFARSRGYPGVLTAAELEMMNLTGDGNGLAIVTMPPVWRDRVPTSNFFQQGGYERNPIAIRNNVVAKLLAATNAVMDKESRLPGAKELAGYFPH
jgi:hypothetical protein